MRFVKLWRKKESSWEGIINKFKHSSFKIHTFFHSHLNCCKLLQLLLDFDTLPPIVICLIIASKMFMYIGIPVDNKGENKQVL